MKLTGRSLSQKPVVIASLRVGELELYLYLITTIFAFKRKKCDKVRVMKAHIGGKIMTFIVQDRQKNVQPAASNSNSESVTDSYRVKRIVGPTNSNFFELNPSRDQAADSQQEKEAEETIPESSAS